MIEPFDWTAAERDDSEDGERLYEAQAEALGLALSVNRQAVLMLSAFPEYTSDHDRIAACRRAFRFASQHVRDAKVRTIMLRSNGAPTAVLGYLDIPVTEADLREAMERFKPYAGGSTSD